MGICFTREKDEFIKYERYIYCETCLAKIKYQQVYVVAHCLNKTHMFCCNECYVAWVYEKI